MIGSPSFSTVIEMLRPAIKMKISELTPFGTTKPIDWVLMHDLPSDKLLFGAFRQSCVVVHRHELDTNVWGHRAVDRIEQHLRRYMPKAHKRYRPIPQIKTRRPSA